MRSQVPKLGPQKSLGILSPKIDYYFWNYVEFFFGLMKTKLTGEVFQTFQNVGTIKIKIIKEVLVDENLELQYQRVFKVSHNFVILWYDEWPSLE